MEKNFIIIRGPAGGGKTTIGVGLAKERKGKFICFDKILKENNLGYLSGEKWVLEKKCLKGNKIVLKKILGKFKNKNVVIEGNFYHKKQIEDLEKNLPKTPKIFTLKANVPTCLERDKTRKPLGEKGIKDFHKLVSKFDYGKIIETEKKTMREVIKEIISFL